MVTVPDIQIKVYMAEKLVFIDKMVEICPDFKWLSLQISGPIWNKDCLQTNLF